MSLTLQFCSFDSVFGRIIPWFTQSDVGHVDAVLPDGSLLGAQHEDGLGGQPAGVRIRPASYIAENKGRNVIRVTVDASRKQRAAFYDFLEEQIGKPYDVTAIEAFAVGRDWHDPGAWYCSELAAAATEAAELVKPLAAPVNRITPGGLLLVWSAIGNVQTA